MADRITITGLRCATRIGVPEEERASWQTVAIDAVFIPRTGFEGIEDDLSKTVDYYAVSLRLRELCAARPRKLIETMANELAEELLEGWPLDRVEVTVRKFILADTDSVAVTVERTAENEE